MMIRVEPEDVLDGTPEVPWDCPLAIAIERQTGVAVSVYPDCKDKRFTKIARRGELPSERTEIRVRGGATAFVRAVDRGAGVGTQREIWVPGLEKVVG